MKPKNYFFTLLLLFHLVCFSADAQTSQSERKIRTLYYSLDPQSLQQLLSFYELYPDTQEGHQALARAWELLTGAKPVEESFFSLSIPSYSIEGLVKLVNKQPSQDIPVLDDSQLEEIEWIARRLANRKLKGHGALNEKETLSLPPEEIDLSRAILLSQLDSSPVSMQKIRSYEALMDLIALQIDAKLPPAATPEQKIRGINSFIFEEMRFRFPPHSKHVKDVDMYTFLPAVLDSRQGVCLGVSILYLCVGQRLNLPLEVITPPGHIYIRYNKGNSVINIETTARGIHLESEDYLSLRCKKLQERNIKEVVGLAQINYASACLKDEKYEEALKNYQKALAYLPEDKLLKELMGYCCLFTGKEQKAASLLQEVLTSPKDDVEVGKMTLIEDYFSHKTDIEAIKIIFLQVDETRTSILKKKDALVQALQKHPEFREGWISLATAWVQLHRNKEALDALEKYHALDPTDCLVEYYLAALNGSRLNYPKAWEHLKSTEAIIKEWNFQPKALTYLRRQLAMKNPE